MLFVTLLLALPLSGCAQLLDEIPFLRRTPVVTPAVATETTATAEPGMETTPAPPEEDLSQITFWLPPAFDPENGSPEGELLRQQLQAFSAANPDVTVNVRVKALSGSGGLLDSLTAASLAAPAALQGSQPDVYTGHERDINRKIPGVEEREPAKDDRSWPEIKRL